MAAQYRSPFLLLLFLLFVAGPAAWLPLCHGHNITRILAEHPEFSTFNHYLSATHLATEINRRLTITVLVVDNSAMNALLSKHLSIYTVKNVLSLHVLADYFGAKKLHQITHRTALVSTLFQATGSAPGTSGFVNITDSLGGRVSFGAEDTGSLDANFVKSVKELPYNISVIQISSLLRSPEAEAPTPAPSDYNLTALMAKKGCKVFSDLLVAAGVEKTYEDNVDSGLTVFCPVDQYMNSFMPKYRNLTAGGKTSLLLYHGLPIYNSIQMLKSGNGEYNTLATDGTTRNYNFTVQNNGEVVTLKTRISIATITGTVMDEQPLAIYTIDKVLEPRELFKVPEKDIQARAPAPSKKPGRKKKEAPAPAADSPDDSAAADEKAADDKSGAKNVGWRWAMLLATAAAAVMAVEF